MWALQDEMLGRIDAFDALLSGLTPSQEDDALGTLRGDGVDDLLRELLPALTGVGVGLVRAHGQASVEEEHAAVGPGREQAAVLGRRGEVWVVLFEAFVDVLEGGRSWSRRADGEAEAVGLVEVVVGVLADDDGFDGWEGCVTRPGGGFD